MKSLFDLFKITGDAAGIEGSVESVSGPFPLRRHADARPCVRCRNCGSAELTMVRSVPSEGPFGLYGARDESWACDVCGEIARREAVE